MRDPVAPPSFIMVRWSTDAIRKLQGKKDLRYLTTWWLVPVKAS